jgi:hypothetical protein
MKGITCGIRLLTAVVAELTLARRCYWRTTKFKGSSINNIKV